MTTIVNHGWAKVRPGYAESVGLIPDHFYKVTHVDPYAAGYTGGSVWLTQDGKHSVVLSREECFLVPELPPKPYRRPRDREEALFRLRRDHCLRHGRYPTVDEDARAKAREQARAIFAVEAWMEAWPQVKDYAEKMVDYCRVDAELTLGLYKRLEAIESEAKAKENERVRRDVDRIALVAKESVGQVLIVTPAAFRERMVAGLCAAGVEHAVVPCPDPTERWRMFRAGLVKAMVASPRMLNGVGIGFVGTIIGYNVEPKQLHQVVARQQRQCQYEPKTGKFANVVSF